MTLSPKCCGGDGNGDGYGYGFQTMADYVGGWAHGHQRLRRWVDKCWMDMSDSRRKGWKLLRCLCWCGIAGTQKPKPDGRTVDGHVDSDGGDGGDEDDPDPDTAAAAAASHDDGDDDVISN